MWSLTIMVLVISGLLLSTVDWLWYCLGINYAKSLLRQMAIKCSILAKIAPSADMLLVTELIKGAAARRG